MAGRVVSQVAHGVAEVAICWPERLSALAQAAGPTTTTLGSPVAQVSG
jgi:hypothetical protein